MLRLTSIQKFIQEFKFLKSPFLFLRCKNIRPNRFSRMDITDKISSYYPRKIGIGKMNTKMTVMSIPFRHIIEIISGTFDRLAD